MSFMSINTPVTENEHNSQSTMRGILKPVSPKFLTKSIPKPLPKKTKSSLRNQFALVDEEEDSDEDDDISVPSSTRVSFNDAVKVILVPSIKSIQAKYAADKKQRKKERRKERKSSPKLSPATQSPTTTSIKGIHVGSSSTSSLQVSAASIAMFVAACEGTSKECAMYYIQRNFGDINNAVNLYLHDPQLYKSVTKHSKISSSSSSSSSNSNNNNNVHRDPKSPVMKAKFTPNTQRHTSKKKKPVPSPLAKPSWATPTKNSTLPPLSLPPSTSVSSTNSSASASASAGVETLDLTLRVQTWAAGIFCVVVAIWLLQVLLPSSTNNTASSILLSNHHFPTTEGIAPNDLKGMQEDMERMKKMWDEGDVESTRTEIKTETEIEGGRGQTAARNKNSADAQTTRKRGKLSRNSAEKIKEKRKKRKKRKSSKLNIADLTKSAMGNLMNEIISADIVMTSPKCGSSDDSDDIDDASVDPTPCVSISPDNHIKFEVHGLERSDFTGKNKHHKLSIGWMWLDTQHIRIDEDSLFDFRRQVTWRSFHTGQSLIGTDAVRAVNGILVEGASSDSADILATPSPPSSTNEYALDDGTIVEAPDDRSADILDIDLRLDGMNGQIHNVTIELDFGLKLGVLARKTTLFRLNRTFWMNEVNVEIISPVPKSTTKNSLTFEYNIKCFDIHQDGYVEVHLFYHPDTSRPKYKLLRTSQVIDHAAGTLDIKGLSAGINSIELVLYKHKNKRKKKVKKSKKKRAFKGKRSSVTWNVLDDATAIPVKNNDGAMVHHIPGVWEDSPLSTQLWKIARNDEDDDNQSLQWRLDDFVYKYNLNTLLKVRAKDGKGLMHWSYEFGNAFIRSWCQKKYGRVCQKYATDIHSKTPEEYGPAAFAAPSMSSKTLKKLIRMVKKKEVIMAAEGYKDGETGWYVNRYGTLMYYELVDGKKWVRIHERQIDGAWNRKQKKTKMEAKRKMKRKKRKKKTFSGGK